MKKQNYLAPSCFVLNLGAEGDLLVTTSQAGNPGFGQRSFDSDVDDIQSVDMWDNSL